MGDRSTTRAYCCPKPNYVGASRLWNNRPHSLGLLACIFATRKQFAGRYFRGKIFSREDIFAGRYFRVNSIFAKISSRENISNSLFAKISSRENNVLYSSQQLVWTFILKTLHRHQTTEQLSNIGCNIGFSVFHLLGI